MLRQFEREGGQADSQAFRDLRAQVENERSAGRGKGSQPQRRAGVAVTGSDPRTAAEAEGVAAVAAAARAGRLSSSDEEGLGFDYWPGSSSRGGGQTT